MSFKYVNGGITAAKGYKASGIHCGMVRSKRPCMVMSEIPPPRGYTQTIKARPALLQNSI